MSNSVAAIAKPNKYKFIFDMSPSRIKCRDPNNITLKVPLIRPSVSKRNNPGTRTMRIGPPSNHLTAVLNSAGLEAGLQRKLIQQQVLVMQLRGFLEQQQQVEPQ